MTSLRFPLKTALREPADQSATRRMWEQIDARLARGRRRRLVPIIGALAVAVAMVVVGLGVLGHRRDAGPLHLADGHPIGPLDGPGAEAPIALHDGSRIKLAPGARFEPLETTGTTFSGMLTRGSAHFDVRPGGPRRWVIECGLATVEVLGTRFGCVRTSGRLRVTVEHGTVLVKGERVPDRVRRLVAGESIEIFEARDPPPAPSFPPPPTAAPRVAKADEPAVPAVPINPAPPGGTVRGAPMTPWRELARNGHHSQAFQQLGVGGIQRETRLIGVEDLLALADVARLSGHPADAVGPLERVLAEFETDPQAPLAAFALGRLELDALRRPTSAAAAFQRALTLGVPMGLREDARARLVESFSRAGDRASAEASAAEYQREFPHGRHARAIAGWLAGQ